MWGYDIINSLICIFIKWCFVNVSWKINCKSSNFHNSKMFTVLFVLYCSIHWLTTGQDLPFNPLSTRPHQNVVWYNNSWLGFLKILISVYQKKERNILQKLSPHLSCAVKCCDSSIWIILGKIICESSNWQHIYKDWRSLFWVQIGNFLDWKGLPNVHILFCLHKTSSFTDL